MNIEIELLDEPTTELTVPARAQLALNSSKTRADLTELVKKSVNIHEIKNTAGRTECHAAAMVLVKVRTAIANTGKAARDDATKFSKAVIAEENALIAITEAEEKRLITLRDEWDAKIAVIKAAEEQAEREQAAKIQARIDGLGFDMRLLSQASSLVLAEKTLLSAVEVSLEIFGNRAGEAEQTKQTTLSQLDSLYASAVAREEQLRILVAQQEALAAAQKKLEDDQAAAVAARMAEDLRLAGLRAEEERRIAAERAKLDADLAAARLAEQAKIDEAARLVREAAAAEQKILDDAAAAERQRLADAAAAESKRLADIAAAERAEEQRLSDIRVAALAAEFAKDERARRLAPDMLTLLKRLLECSRHGDFPPDELVESVERIIEQATGEAA